MLVVLAGISAKLKPATGMEKTVRNRVVASRLRDGKQTNPVRQTLSTAILQCLTLDAPTSREWRTVHPGLVYVIFWNRFVAFQDLKRPLGGSVDW